MKKFVFMLAMAAILSGCKTASRDWPDEYDVAVSQWQTDRDVAAWLDDNFSFSNGRQSTIQNRLKKKGPGGLLVRDHKKLYNSSSGYCADAANFAIEALNEIDPKYGAGFVFVENAKGRPNHWVAGYKADGKIWIMDYGAGSKWNAMNGVHGPYDSLEEYKAFLASLNVSGFRVGDVYWRDMPGEWD